MTTDKKAVRGGLSPDAATIDLRKRLDKTQPATAFSAVEPNELKGYSNLSYNFIIAPLTPEELSLMQLTGSYPNQLKNVILASGGIEGKKRQDTAFGPTEFFINNVEISQFATPTKISGLSGNWTVNFDVIEPYSVGLFMQTLHAAALKSGYNSYIECVYLMRVEFLGTGLDGKQTKITFRDYMIKLMQIQFSANEGGSKYIVKALDFNLEAFNNVYGNYYGTMTISGSTVGEVLQKLAAGLNKDQQEQKKGNVQEVDDYIIKVDGKNSEKIAESLFTAADAQQSGPGDNSANTKNNTQGRGNQRKSGVRSFTFPKLSNGRTIVSMIQEIMLASEYCATATQDQKIIRPYGYVRWYRPSATVQFKSKRFKHDAIQNRPAYTITYVVKPYLAHHSNFSIPSEVALGFQSNALPATIKKKYDYIYTGQNDDIIRWELKFDNTFYTAISSQGFQNTRGSVDPGGKTVVPSQTGGNQAGTDTAKLYNLTPAGKLLRDSPGSYSAPMGGGTNAETVETRVARAFEQSLLLDTDMVMLDLTILGDPYFLSKSGVFLKDVTSESEAGQKNIDGTMSSEDVEIRVYLRFKSPIDAPRYGEALYQFANAGFNDSPYSGLYRVRTVKSKFNDGVFTQELNLFRDRGQTILEIENTRTDPSLQAIGSAPAPNPNSQPNDTAAPPAAKPAPAPPPPPAASNEAARAAEDFRVEQDTTSRTNPAVRVTPAVSPESEVSGKSVTTRNLEKLEAELNQQGR